MSPKKPPTKPVAVYTRVSDQGSRSDEELQSHEIQRAKVEAYLGILDMPISTDRFEDNSKSGRKMSRPAFDRALAGVRDGSLGGIAVYKLSRFGRNTRGVLTLVEEIEALGATFVCISPTIDTSNANGRFMLTIFAAIDEMEAERAAEDAGVLGAKKIEAGTSTGGTAPVGYEFELTGRDSNGKNLLGWLVPSDDAPVVLAAFEKVAQGGTAGQAADVLNAAGVKTSWGNPWRDQTVRGLLSNEVYIGTRKYGETRIEKAHEPIIEPWLFRKVQKQIAPKGVKASRTRNGGHVLGNGLCRCSTCGAGMTRGISNGKYPTLRCNARGGGHTSIAYGLAEDWITSVAFSHIGLTVRHEGGNADEVGAAEADLALAQEALADVEALRGSIAAVSFALAHSDAATAVETAEDALAGLSLDAGESSLLFPLANREEFRALEIPEQRAALRALVKSVVIAPGKQGSKKQDVGARVVVEFADGTYHPAHAAPGWQPSIPEDARVVTFEDLVPGILAGQSAETAAGS